jgi:hypothetical protein
VTADGYREILAEEDRENPLLIAFNFDAGAT